MDLKDELLSQRVYSLLHQVKELGHLPIKPVCRKGVVYLRGRVDAPEKLSLAKELAESITGVRAVVNQLGLLGDKRE